MSLVSCSRLGSRSVTAPPPAPPRARPPLRVGVLAESELVAAGLVGMLAPYRHRVVVDLLPDKVLEEPRALAGVDVVLCDPFTPGPGHEARLLAWLAHAPGVPVLVHTWQTHASAVERALDAGADGWVAKTAPAAELVVAVEAVHRGEAVPAQAGPPAFPGLSGRESEVLVLLCRGQSNSEIAEALFVSVNSVKTYVRQVYAKTGVSRRTQAVAWAHRQGWTG